MFLTKSAAHGTELCHVISLTGDLGGVFRKLIFVFISYVSLQWIKSEGSSPPSKSPSVLTHCLQSTLFLNSIRNIEYNLMPLYRLISHTYCDDSQTKEVLGTSSQNISLPIAFKRAQY